MSDGKKTQKKEWSEMSKKEKASGIVILVIIFFVILAIFTPNVEDTTENLNQQAASEEAHSTEASQETSVEETTQEKTFESISKLIDSKQAFDTGSYIKGDIPKGEYAFISFDGSGKYYSEEDAAGNIIDNENFDSFGYVYVHAAGNIETQGVLIKIGAFKQLEAKGAKEIYEKLNNVKEYKRSAWYKVGSDISPGQYTIESLGQGYVAVMSGPVGNNDIIDNNNFNGKYSVNVQKGQYLQVSRGEIK